MEIKFNKNEFEKHLELLSALSYDCLHSKVDLVNELGRQLDRIYNFLDKIYFALTMGEELHFKLCEEE